MIGPDEIKKESLRWYKDILISSIRDQSYFPKEVRFGKIKAENTLKDYVKIQKELNLLKNGSKEKIGYGYSIDYKRRKDQKIGEQSFPDRIYFETLDDYLQFTGKEQEYRNFKIVTHNIITEIPKLESWILNHPVKVLENSEKWDDLLKVCRFFIKNPKTNIYIREIPLDISTKFVEENKAILRLLLDFLIEENINSGENDFERRFNLKFKEPLIRIRILDSGTARKLFFGIDDLSIPHSQFVALNIPCSSVIILENHINFSNIFNFLTLPHLKDAIAIFGSGFQIGLLKEAEWLANKKIVYWGDIDVHGFQILSRIRGHFPKTKSCMMDFETFNEFRNLTVTGSETGITELEHLNSNEHHLYSNLLGLKENNRLEQEKIPHSYALLKIQDAINRD